MDLTSVFLLLGRPLQAWTIGEKLGSIRGPGTLILLFKASYLCSLRGDPSKGEHDSPPPC